MVDICLAKIEKKRDRKKFFFKMPRKELANHHFRLKT